MSVEQIDQGPIRAGGEDRIDLSKKDDAAATDDAAEDATEEAPGQDGPASK